MEYEIGKQYKNDDRIDGTHFRKTARLHQSKYRAEILQVGYNQYGNRLTKEDALAGLNFYTGFNILNEVKRRYKKYSDKCYADMLRSEHIPFNFFIPLKSNLGLAGAIFNNRQYLNDAITLIREIKVEYSPKPRKEFLNDRTSFDVYIEYEHRDNTKGILGIEVKYTEHEYKLRKGSKEEADVANKQSIYYKMTDKSGLYKQNFVERLRQDTYRQVWRNQLLGESIIRKEKSKYGHFTSVLLYPKGNLHFEKVVRKYFDFLLPQTEPKFLSITYEEFIEAIKISTTEQKYLDWADFLADRYIIKQQTKNTCVTQGRNNSA